jgi:fatty acid desaturase
MAHDGTHGLLSSNKTFNDLLVELTLAWPVMLSLPAYRRMHRLHHRHLNTDVDPDFARNRPDRLATRTNIVQFVQILSGINPEQREMLRFIKGTSHEHDPEPAPLVPRVVVYGVVLGSAVVFGHVDLLAKYWLAPFFSWFLVSMRLKGITEHFAVDSTAPCRASRTLKAGFLWRFLVAPKNVSLHIEHHLYPSVPFYRLPALHTALMALPAYRAHAHITVGYMAFVRECLAFNRRPAPSTTTPIAAILPRRTAA